MAQNDKVGRFWEIQQEVSPPEPYQVTSKITINPPTRKQMQLLRTAETAEASDRAVLGEHYDEIVALYDERPFQEWDKFIDELTERFFGKGANEVPGKSEESSDS